jgi:threonine synthase
VSDDEIIKWQGHLNRLEGLFVEPTSATVLGAAERLVSDGTIRSDQKVLFPLTGFGFKEPMPSILK